MSLLSNYNLGSSIYMNEIEFVNTIQSMIQSNQPYYSIFDTFIRFALDQKIFMNYFKMHNAVRIYIQPYASTELLQYLKKNIDNL